MSEWGKQAKQHLITFLFTKERTFTFFIILSSYLFIMRCTALFTLRRVSERTKQTKKHLTTPCFSVIVLTFRSVSEWVSEWVSVLVSECVRACVSLWTTANWYEVRLILMFVSEFVFVSLLFFLSWQKERKQEEITLHISCRVPILWLLLVIYCLSFLSFILLTSTWPFFVVRLSSDEPDLSLFVWTFLLPLDSITQVYRKKVILCVC